MRRVPSWTRTSTRRSSAGVSLRWRRPGCPTSGPAHRPGRDRGRAAGRGCILQAPARRELQRQHRDHTALLVEGHHGGRREGRAPPARGPMASAPPAARRKAPRRRGRSGAAGRARRVAAAGRACGIAGASAERSRAPMPSRLLRVPRSRTLSQCPALPPSLRSSVGRRSRSPPRCPGRRRRRSRRTRRRGRPQPGASPGPAIARTSTKRPPVVRNSRLRWR